MNPAIFMATAALLWTGHKPPMAHVPTPTPAALISTYVARGLAWWGKTPACGQPQVIIVPQSVLGPGIMGDANLATCVIRLPSTYVYWAPEMECRVTFHEEGHLEGFGHQPGTIMQAVYYEGPFAQCDS